MDSLADRIAAIRRFNRIYTRLIGALDEGHLGGPYGLAEVRVIYELAQAPPQGVTPKAIAAETGLDPGYLSRILKRFEREALVARSPSPEDRRSITLSLTPTGRAVFETFRQGAEDAVTAMLAPLPTQEQSILTTSMRNIEALLLHNPAAELVLRPHRVGDMGWVTQRHADLYAEEYGWDERFEALVARICADFIEGFDPARERCWIAERDGVRLGSIFLVKGEGDEAKLRLLLIEPSARGLGLGKRLVSECLAFAKAAGYGGVTLWTQSILTAARGIYAAAGFELVDSTPHRTIGVDLVGETWKLRF